MFFMFRKFKHILAFVFLILFLNPMQDGNHIIPVTYLVSDYESANLISTDTDLTTFIIDVAEPTCDAITGIYVKDKFQLSVTQQPANQPGFVSTSSGMVTQFTYAAEHGSIGLLAHNYLAGSDFYKIESNDKINLIYGDGQTKIFIVTEIRQFQALEPTSPYSSFISIADPSQKFTYAELFSNIYEEENRLVLQTCMSSQDNSSWGRHFVIAVPVQ